MKKKFNLFTVVLFISIALSQSCSSDSDSSPSKTLVLGSMFTGQFYTVNTKTGVLTELFIPQFNSADFTDIRAFVYHPKEEKYFVSTTYNGGWNAGTYTIDPVTKEVTLLNDNDNGIGGNIWRTIPNWYVGSDDNLIAVGDFNSIGEGFTKINPTTGDLTGTFVEEPRGMCCGYGMVHFSKDKQIIVANGDNQSDGSIDFSIYNEDFEIQSGFSITNFIGFTEDVPNDWWTIRSMASEANSKSGAVYGVLVNSDTGDTYLVKIDFSKSTITRISDLDTAGGYDFAPLAFVPGSVAQQ